MLSRMHRLIRLRPATKAQACLTLIWPAGMGRRAVRATWASKSRSTMSFTAQPAPRIRQAPMAKPTISHSS